MPDDDYTCKYLYEGECWRYFKPRSCPDKGDLVKMRQCKQFKETMI